MRTGGLISRKDFVALEEDADGAWMSKEGKVKTLGSQMIL